MFASQRFARLHEGAQYPVEAVASLQLAQACGVRRGHVDRNVVRTRVNLVQTGHVVVLGLFDRRVEILADADAADALVAAQREATDEMIDARVVEAHAVDEGPARAQPEHARLRVAGLGARRHGAELDVAETERTERVEMVAVLVEAGGESESVGEAQAETLHAEFGGNGRGAPQRPEQSQARESEVVSGLRIETRQQRQRRARKGRRSTPLDQWTADRCIMIDSIYTPRLA